VEIKKQILQIGMQARRASRELALLDTETKNNLLQKMGDALENGRQFIEQANQQDLIAGKNANLSSALLDRLELSPRRIDAMIQGILDVIALKDPVGEILKDWQTPAKLHIRKVRVPIGVIGIIFESRPNVTVDSSVLCFKASNAVILRGGKEALHSNSVLAHLLQASGEKNGLPRYSIQMVTTTDREAVKHLVQMENFVDCVIPRGGEGLIRAVTEQARVPVIKHYKGVCHTYVHSNADLDMALRIIENAKCQRPGVCNAMETLLVHSSLANSFLPKIAERLQLLGVEMRGDDRSRSIVAGFKEAKEEDWYAEYLDLILAIKVVDSLEEAIEHINTYGSHHSDAIITSCAQDGRVFCQAVDSAAVFVNTSTRFTDGSEFGLGAEIGISTDKLHARGPMGLEELTTYKYLIDSDGMIRA